MKWGRRAGAPSLESNADATPQASRMNLLEMLVRNNGDLDADIYDISCARAARAAQTRRSAQTDLVANEPSEKCDENLQGQVDRSGLTAREAAWPRFLFAPVTTS